MSMYAYWLANTGLTVHKLTGLMTEGIGAEELYALQESQMKKIRVLDEKDVEIYITHPVKCKIHCTVKTSVDFISSNIVSCYRRMYHDY